MNTLVFFMSILPTAPVLMTYNAGDFTLTGTQTNEAAAKYTIKTLAEKNRQLDRIIAITSRETKDGALEVFRSGVSEFCGKQYPVPELIAVDNFDSENELPDETVLARVMEYITSDDMVYLDVSGGKRTDADMMLLLMKLVRYKGIRLADALYSAKHGTTGEISSHNAFYRNLDILDGVNQFAVTGKSTQLSQCFSAFDAKSSVRRLLSVMEEFSSCMTLCSTSALDDILKRMKPLIAEVSEASGSDMESFLFRQLIPVINSKFFGTGDEPDYCQIILWCLDNHLVQQAVTTFVEKMPKYLFDKGLISATDKLKEEVSATFKKHEELNLEKELFFSRLMSADGLSDEEKEIEQLIEQVKTALTSGGWYSGEDRRVLTAVKTLNGFKRRYITEGCSGKAIKAILDDPKAGESFHSIAETLSGRPLPNNAYSFLKVLVNENNILRAALGFSPAIKKGSEDTIEKKVRTIENVMTMTLPEGFTLNISREELRQCMIWYLYARSVRNRINHAADNNNTTERMEKMCTENGIDTAFRENIIIEQLKKSVRYISDITPQETEEKGNSYALSH